MKKILIAPLDWGLGHATRCIPVISELLNAGCEVVIAGNGSSLALLRMEFPELPSVTLPGYQPVYPAAGSMIWKMALQIPKFAEAIKMEHRAVQKIVAEMSIDVIISDNRYGCWSESVLSVLITHQSNVLMPRRFGWLAPFVRRIVGGHMKRFGYWWVPDLPDHRLSGLLTSFDPAMDASNTFFIGAISRFERKPEGAQRFDVAAILSGPEPQRTMLENLVVLQLQRSGLRYFVVRGLPHMGEMNRSETMSDFMTSHELQELIQSSRIIISRSGYSSVMDMAVLGKKSIFIPTPGQTEQEYLARDLKKKGIAYAVSQKEFDLQIALKESDRYSGFQDFPSGNAMLKAVIKKLIHDRIIPSKQMIPS